MTGGGGKRQVRLGGPGFDNKTPFYDKRQRNLEIGKFFEGNEEKI